MPVRAAGAVAVALLLAAAAPAAAQPIQQKQAPACSTLDRVDGESRAGLDIVYTAWKDGAFSPGTSVTALWFDGWAEWLDPAGMGAYAILPLAYGKVSNDATSDSVDETAFLDAELGGIYRREIGPGATLASHLGVTLPLAPEATTGTFDGLAGFANADARPNDFVQSRPKQSFVRIGTSGAWRRESLFLRAEAGLDVRVYNGSNDTSNAPTIGRINLAGGFDGRGFAVLGELVNTVDLHKLDRGEDEVFHWLSVSGHFAGGPVQPSVAVTLPLDEATRNVVSVVVTGGIAAQLY